MRIATDMLNDEMKGKLSASMVIQFKREDLEANKDENNKMHKKTREKYLISWRACLHNKRKDERRQR